MVESGSRGKGLVLSFQQLGSRPGGGVEEVGRKNLIHYRKKSPSTNSPLRLTDANQARGKGRTPISPSGVEHGTGEKGRG